MTHREIFSAIYRDRVWGDGSGGGSAPGVAGPWAAIASKVIADLKPKTVLDVGCGDGWASADIKMDGAWYIGVDPVQEMVDQCNDRYKGNGGRSYFCRDAITEDLPAADLVLLKEVTQHLSDASVLALLEKLRKYPAVLHCFGFAPGTWDHSDIEDGGYRPTSLRRYGYREYSSDLLGEWEHGGTKYFAELWRPR